MKTDHQLVRKLKTYIKWTWLTNKYNHNINPKMAKYNSLHCLLIEENVNYLVIKNASPVLIKFIRLRGRN